MVEDRALVHAVSAPRSGDDEDFHLSNEAGQQLLLSRRQVDLIVNVGPTLSLFLRAVCREKVGVAQSIFKLYSRFIMILNLALMQPPCLENII